MVDVVGENQPVFAPTNVEVVGNVADEGHIKGDIPVVCNALEPSLLGV